jgi:DNA-nicking Smr family endonuclease
MFDKLIKCLTYPFVCVWHSLRSSNKAEQADEKQRKNSVNDIEIEISRSQPGKSRTKENKRTIQVIPPQSGSAHLQVVNETQFRQHDKKKQLTYDDKRNIYDQARAPVNKMREDRTELRKHLKRLPQKGHNNAEFKKTQALIRDIESKLPLVEKRAAAEIFNKMNSASGMGSNKFDFHGLHVDEAKIIARVFIVPELAAVKKITIITGRGVHSKDGKSKLKEALQKYFIHELKIKCENVIGNEGAFVLSA